MDQVRRIEEALDDFKDTLPLYREQLESWYSRAGTGPAKRPICLR
jgi:hypothetical protein